MIKIEGQEELEPYPAHMYQLILKKQLDLSYYSHISIDSSDKFPICDFNFFYDYLLEKVQSDKEQDADELILLSKACQGAQLQKKSAPKKFP